MVLTTPLELDVEEDLSLSFSDSHSVPVQGRGGEGRGGGKEGEGSPMIHGEDSLWKKMSSSRLGNSCSTSFTDSTFCFCSGCL